MYRARCLGISASLYIYIFCLLLLATASAREHEIEVFCISKILVDLPLPDTFRVVISVVLVSATVWAMTSIFLLLVFQCERLSVGILIFKAENHI